MTLGGTPFGVAVTSDGKFSFVPIGNHVVVLNNNHGSLTPTQVTSIQAAGAKKGIAITRNGKYALAAASSGAYVIDVAQAEQGSSSAMLGTLTSPGGKGAVEVSISPDDRFAFVTLQYSSELAVFNLQVSLAHGFGQSGFVGMVPFGEGAQPVGIAQSPDDKWLYVAIQNPAGKLEVLSMSRAEKDPKNAVQTTAAAAAARRGSWSPRTARTYGSPIAIATRSWRSPPISCSRNRRNRSSPRSVWARPRSA